MELQLLHYIQTLHTPELTSFFLALTKLLGSKGYIVIILSLILSTFPKTRRYGLCMLVAYGLAALVGSGLKQLIARPRPFVTDSSVWLLLKAPKGYSCPSNHTALAFATAMSVYFQNHKWGYLAIAVASIVAFSRLYFFVHYPSDIILGAILGSISAYIAYRLLNKYGFDK